MLSPPADTKFYDELGRSLKPAIVKGIIDVWANWTNLATQEPFLQWQTGLEENKEAILPLSRIDHSQWFYNSFFLWIQIITVTIQLY